MKQDVVNRSFCFKLYRVVNNLIQLLPFCSIPGEVYDRHTVPKLAKGLMGKL
jgi:hypothetical protein